MCETYLSVFCKQHFQTLQNGFKFVINLGVRPRSKNTWGRPETSTLLYKKTPLGTLYSRRTQFDPRQENVCNVGDVGQLGPPTSMDYFLLSFVSLISINTKQKNVLRSSKLKLGLNQTVHTRFKRESCDTHKEPFNQRTSITSRGERERKHRFLRNDSRRKDENTY